MTSIPKVRVLFILGTRPEVIKLAPLIQILKQETFNADVWIADTMQHSDLKSPAMGWFGLTADDVVQEGWQQQNPMLGVEALRQPLSAIIANRRPHYVIVQGDTTSAYAGAMAGASQGSCVVHVEAGLRSGNLDEPWPEEYFRIEISRLASLHMAPTARDRDNLLREGIDPDAIHIVGNTVIDALQMTLLRLKAVPSNHVKLPENPFILLTLHRRENLEHRQAPLTQLLQDICTYTDMPILFPVHDNPRVKEWAHVLTVAVPRLQLLPALNYPEFVQLLADCRFVISDSGGIQEEAGYLHKPMILLREYTERHLAITHGAVICMSTNPKLVAAGVATILNNSLTRTINPLIFGDGTSAHRIATIIKEKKRI